MDRLNVSMFRLKRVVNEQMNLLVHEIPFVTK